MKISKNNILLERGLFFINFVFVIAAILIFYFQLTLEYFFYCLISTTFAISYLMFTKHKTFAKGIILTNLFVYFYFLYPYIAEFITQILHAQGAYVLILYTLLLAYLFLEFLGQRQKVFNTLRKINLKQIYYVFVLGIFFGVLFRFIGEPIPSQFINSQVPIIIILIEMLFISILIGVSEQLLFTGFLFNAYSTMTREIDAQIQTSLLFIAFHMLRIKALVSAYFIQFGNYAGLFLLLYFVALFIFMNISIMLFRGTRFFKGSITYSMLFHIIVDFTLILLTGFLIF